jgi:hypothetical protein
MSVIADPQGAVFAIFQVGALELNHETEVHGGYTDLA